MTEAAGSTDWPSEIRLRSGGAVLSVAFDGAAVYELPAEYLRVILAELTRLLNHTCLAGLRRAD